MGDRGRWRSVGVGYICIDAYTVDIECRHDIRWNSKPAMQQSLFYMDIDATGAWFSVNSPLKAGAKQVLEVQARHQVREV